MFCPNCPGLNVDGVKPRKVCCCDPAELERKRIQREAEMKPRRTGGPNRHERRRIASSMKGGR